MKGFLTSSRFSDRDKAMWHSLNVIAFFGLLRISEFTCPSKQFDSAVHLTHRDISFRADSNIMYVTIKASKTDPFRSGVVVRVAAISNHPLCPVSAMKAYLGARGPIVGPLYLFSDGSFVTRKHVVAFLHMSLPGVSNINTHSFRIGGASAASSAGASDSMVRAMGRWSSDCFHRYFHISDSQVSQFQHTLSTTVNHRTWVSD